MLCPKCGYYADGDENVCPSCGNVINGTAASGAEGAQAIRQGKRAREAALRRPCREEAASEEIRKRRSGASHATLEMPSVKVKEERFAGRDYFDSMTVSETNPEGPSFERRRRALYDDSTDPEQTSRYAVARQQGRWVHRRMINWIKLGMIIVVLVFLLIGGVAAYLKWTPSGQLIVTRTAIRFPNLNIKVSATSLWTIGEEFMDKGQVMKAIECFEQAKSINEDEGVLDVDGLLMLGSAYEASGQIEKAAELYEYIYDKTPSRSEAYKAHIRILENTGQEGDLTRAGELMKTAYENTKDTVFLTQRNDFLPRIPEVNLTAAYYEKVEHITLTSSQGFDIYYTFDAEAKLPVDGIKFKEPITLDEGVYSLRAVCVNGELVSDELKGTYTISMPRPKMPQSNLAPKTYKTKQKVKLKPGKDNINDDDIEIYYTIDGSPPDRDSPKYTGEAINLPTGWVILRAVAVNRYNKTSNELTVKYKIEAKPWPKEAFTNDDTIDKIRLGITTQLEFFETYGEGEFTGVIDTAEYDTECRRYDYDWGYAVMNLTRKTWVIVEIGYTSGGRFSAPRGTNIGDEEEYITKEFKDMGQVESENKNRGLYYNDKGSGKIWQETENERLIRYIYIYETHTLTLEYSLKNNAVYQIRMKYVP